MRVRWVMLVGGARESEGILSIAANPVPNRYDHRRRSGLEGRFWFVVFVVSMFSRRSIGLL